MAVTGLSPYDLSMPQARPGLSEQAIPLKHGNTPFAGSGGLKLSGHKSTDILQGVKIFG